MDVQTALVGVAVFIVSAGVLLFISMFGMKEKSYEEALAEQRQQANALLGTQTRPKPKEKKVKKANKKVKEKQHPVAVEPETAEESEDTESPPSSTSSTAHPQQKLHVEFKEPTVIEQHSVAETQEKQVSSKKEDNAVKAEHQKEKPNKLKQNGAEQEPLKEKGQKGRQNSLEGKENKSKQSEPIKDKKEKQPEPVKDKTHKEKQLTSAPDAQKQKKTSKPAPAAVQLLVEKEESVVDVTIVPHTNGHAPTTNKEKKKKKSEFNTLQQISGTKDGDVNLSLLLNVVRKAELSRSEVQILIDLLLNKQHEAPAVLDEWSEGKADPIQKLKKQLAEKEKALAEEQEALLGAQAKLREIRAEQTAEKSQLQQRARGLEEALQAKHLELQASSNRIHGQNLKIQQMQTQINEEGSALRKLREEIAALQLQRQQIDIHITQAQEAEATVQDLQSRNNQLTIELHSLNEQNMSAKEHQQNLIVQLQHQVNHFKTELDEKENFVRQCEDIRRDLEQRLGFAHRQEDDLKVELSQLKSVCQQNTEEIRRLEHGKGQALEEVRNSQIQKEELERVLTQLKAELSDVQAEKSELQVLKANGVSQENQTHKEEILNLHNELSSVKSELQSVEKKYTVDLDASNNTLKQLQNELDEQKNKNNEIISRVRLEEQDSNKKFIERLFPDIQISDNSSYDQWAVNVEKAIERHVSGLEKSKAQENQPEVTKLQAQVQHYKTIIDDTEGILKKLENHIEQEEIHWRKELKTKESEIEMLKQQHLSELQTKVQQLELKLTTEQDEKQKMTEAYELLKSRSSSQADPAIIEKLSEEVNLLNEQLFLEKRKNLETQQSGHETNDVGIKEQNSNSTNGPSIQANSN